MQNKVYTIVTSVASAPWEALRIKQARLWQRAAHSISIYYSTQTHLIAGWQFRKTYTKMIWLIWRPKPVSFLRRAKLGSDLAGLGLGITLLNSSRWGLWERSLRVLIDAPLLSIRLWRSCWWQKRQPRPEVEDMAAWWWLHLSLLRLVAWWYREH